MFSQLYLVAINRTEVGWQIVGRACSREAHWLKCCLMWTIVSASDRVVGWGGVACRVLFFIFIIVTNFFFFFMLFTLTQRVQYFSFNTCATSIEYLSLTRGYIAISTGSYAFSDQCYTT